jgi:F0F1-type ATP synthase assembly protein I
VPSLLNPRLLLHALGALVLGLLVGAVGTVVHRSTRPWGLVVALLAVLAAAVAVRAWSGWVALVGLLVGLFAAVQVLASTGPGGDVMMPASDAYGWLWVGGAVLVPVLVGAAPRSWFADTPLRRAARTPDGTPAP